LADVGYVDQVKDYLFLTDRQDNVIISGGVNIYPQEAENLLTTHRRCSMLRFWVFPMLSSGEVKAVVQFDARCRAVRGTRG